MKIIPLMVIGATPIPAKMGKIIFSPNKTAFGDFIRLLWTIALIGGSFVLILGQSYSPFLYFKF
jgi:hypothetical protein